MFCPCPEINGMRKCRPDFRETVITLQNFVYPLFVELRP